ncbi:serine/threonine protein kinase [Paucibacter sp. DJ1R-11]|uniref:serine/threonine-protein kinase n=1 Tax=Paucibacter sp. DJ1R-11 TaxID=2893556 RepID=UPI0021E4FFA1|nr:serine/threonine-protein kinase [Paucibacter sp. DJ1R-11]MCV2362111.1 serine/threonine protein kinase [Paucibacter sp. DJ1R-11]
MGEDARQTELNVLLRQAQSLADVARGPWLAALSARDEALASELAQRLMQQAETQFPAPAMSPAGSAAPALDEITDAPSLSGQRMGAWQLLRKIGEGGMGQVWLARRADGLYEQEVVVKLLRSDLQQAPLSQRFARERAVLARLKHPGIARLLDAGIADGVPYLVLEYVAGHNLGEHVRAECPTLASRVALLIRVAQAVEHAHAQLVVHRDLKPSNVMVSSEGEVKVLDFGIAGLLDEEDPGHLTRVSGRGLTLSYASPEQLSGAPVGVAADVFSLGVLLFEMISGRLPFYSAGSSRTAIEYALLHQDAPRLGALLTQAPDADAPVGARPLDAERARGDLEAIVAKTLRKLPEERYPAVGALIEDLSRWLRHRPVSARREDWRHRIWLWLRRNALAASLSGGLAFAVLLGLGVSLDLWRRAQAAARESDQVTLYLTELLGSASPDVHGGQAPTVMALLEKSRSELAGKFQDEPATKARLLSVLAQTYASLDRYDLAAPLAREWVALTAQLYGEDDERTVDAHIKLAQIHVPTGPHDLVVAELEPLRERVARLHGPKSDRMREIHYALANGYMKTGRLAEAKAALDQAGELVRLLYPEGHFYRTFHHMVEAVRLAGEGRIGEAREQLRLTEPALQNPPKENLRHALAIRRNILTMDIRAGKYEGVQARAQALGEEMDRLHGRGNSMRAFMYPEIARYHSDRAEYAQALAARQAFNTLGSGAPFNARTAAKASLLLARAQAGAAPAASLRNEAFELLEEIESTRAQMGVSRAEAWLALARSGLLLGELGLAGEAIARLRGDTDLHLDRDLWLESRVAQAEGELLRARGDLAGSRLLLARRVDLLETSPDRQVPPLWQARLDLALTLVMMGAPDVAKALAAAREARPPQMPAGHPFDALQELMQAQLDAPASDSRAARQARSALKAGLQENAAHPPEIRADLGGWF